MNALILAIDTSCDETSAAVSSGRRVLSNIISSQVNLHKKYGGVYPALAKRAHSQRIDPVVQEALKRARKAFENLSAIAVTDGPGLAIALEVGIAKAKQLARKYGLPLIAINHMEGHIYSTLARNRNGKPERELAFPALALLVSGGHTELVLMKNHGFYQVLGETLDDACGEALDKAARILKLGYPGGPIIEALAEPLCSVPSDCRAPDFPKYPLNPPLKEKKNLNFSYSGLKTQFLYLVEKLSEKELGQNLTHLAASFQEASFEQLVRKTSEAIEMYQPKILVCAGGVMANQYLRKLLRRVSREKQIPVYFPSAPRLIGDNAAMIGVAASYKYQRKEFVKNIEALDRKPRLSL
ncbi:MAG TPA: tRNA (adenosine(37)-N6)-threonylcarbamoyltransferase complex transferase subunit TsaD [Clostridia bacterium]|nr:tRNA (adenosine(37)-N6)-threonylcarbamoyltransferase complex transferase subunit TsaD [Clostridia bacterium]